MSSFLEKYKRQPKIYIDLPSQGTFYSPEVLEDQKFTSLPVFGMSAMDEIMFKTPDALFSGEATAQVIRSCIPSILDPWSIVGYDLDYLLISIRIATYGDTIPVSTSCPKCDEQTQNEINLSGLLANFANHGVKESFDINELTFNLKPITYKASTDFSVQRYHIDRAIAQLENQDVSYEDEENIELDPDAIVDFISNNDSEFYTKLQDGITALTEKWNLPAFDITCASEECNHTYKTTLDLDYSSFFGLRSSHSRSLRS